MNKPLKDEVKKIFQALYAEMQEQLKTVSTHEVKVDVTAGIIKAKNLAWYISAYESIQAIPEIIVNGFREAGIFEAVLSVKQDF